ncbi:CU044_2847 family protein [Streptomyces sp. NPDC046261]|uniref:CU044_2847 family protein n=1 Tax=Streptomyces sp. NPDC046261 TaxID=3157200 RepID=UPI0033FA045B
MGQLVEFPSGGSGTILVEVSERAGGTVTRGLRESTVVQRAQHTFEDAVHRVEPAVQAVVAHLRSAAQSPDEIRVEFGIDLHAEAGAYIAKASTTANFTVALTWHREEQ